MPSDIDREFVLAFNINDETSSFMVRDNLAYFFPNVPTKQYLDLVVAPSFAAAHSYHAINGEQLHRPSAVCTCACRHTRAQCATFKIRLLSDSFLLAGATLRLRSTSFVVRTTQARVLSWLAIACVAT